MKETTGQDYLTASSSKVITSVLSIQLSKAYLQLSEIQRFTWNAADCRERAEHLLL
ncbi:unnamed protein product, partial [Linum tenue]